MYLVTRAIERTNPQQAEDWISAHMETIQEAATNQCPNKEYPHHPLYQYPSHALNTVINFPVEPIPTSKTLAFQFLKISPNSTFPQSPSLRIRKNPENKTLKTSWRTITKLQSSKKHEKAHKISFSCFKTLKIQGEKNHPQLCCVSKNQRFQQHANCSLEGSRIGEKKGIPNREEKVAERGKTQKR